MLTCEDVRNEIQEILDIPEICWYIIDESNELYKMTQDNWVILVGYDNYMPKFVIVGDDHSYHALLSSLEDVEKHLVTYLYSR